MHLLQMFLFGNN